MSTVADRPERGLLIVNADDLGGNPLATDRIIDGFGAGALTSATAMVHMADSARAASLARRVALPTGLHLNLTQPYEDPMTPDALVARQLRVTRFLAHPMARRAAFWPPLLPVIRQVIADQLDAFRRLFGVDPTHLDGHNHAHLNPTALVALPRGMPSRPAYRAAARRGARRIPLAARDRLFAARHPGPERFFPLTGIHPALGGAGLERALELARHSAVEIMAHPDRDDANEVLRSASWAASLADARLGTYSDLARRR